MTNAEEEPYFCIECKEEIEQGKHDEDLIHIGQASRQAEIIEMIDKFKQGLYLAIDKPKRLVDEVTWNYSIAFIIRVLSEIKQQILEEKK